jgi:hypothetical protein
MKIPIQIALESAALTLGSAVLFASFFQFNGWLFADWAYRENVNWVFLPAGFRIILVLVLGLPGSLGIALGTWYLDRELLSTGTTWLVMLNGVVSGFTPYVVMKVMGKGKSSDQLMQELTTDRLLNCTLIFSAANSVAHQLVWALHQGPTVNILVDVWPMFIGDTLGALLMLYGLKLVLSRLHIKQV